MPSDDDVQDLRDIVASKISVTLDGVRQLMVQSPYELDVHLAGVDGDIAFLREALDKLRGICGNMLGVKRKVGAELGIIQIQPRGACAVAIVARFR